MGSLDRRLGLLEDRSRERAAAEVRGAWDRLADAEIARIVAPFRFGREPTTEETAAQEAFREEVPEDLIVRAIGLCPGTEEVEIDRRIKELLAPVIKRRRAGVSRELARM